MTNIQVEVREKVNLFDEKRWRVVVACGDASQHLRWLAFASCLRVALDTGDVPAKFVPQVVKKMDGTMLDANKCIKDLLEDGSEVVIECSNGPKSLMLDLEERPADCVAGDSDCGLIGMDIRSGGACNILELVDWSVYGIKDITRAKSVFAPHVGLLQTLVIWYSCQGKELEDKDFGALNLAQFVQLFQEAMGADLSVNALEKAFKDLLMVNGLKGSYQVTLIEFLPAVLFVASESPQGF